tara:strand:- start:250 stop:1266 length:1017 start_codon:yes stop_codon:yes gene_type:complete
MNSKTILLLLIGFLLFGNLEAQELSDKANVFLHSLSDELRAKALFPLDDAERFNMNYIPIIRKGPTFHDFDDLQKTAALALLRASVSQVGYQKSIQIMELEKVLLTIDRSFAMPDGTGRDPLNYHFCVFGTPSPNNAWGWRFEGHHISLNFTSDEGHIVSSTPLFMGSNPGIVNIGEQRGKQVLQKESELGFRLVSSLNADQLKIAKFSDEAPQEILTANHRKAHGIEKLGIPFTRLTDTQKTTFLELLDVYIGNYIFEFSETFRNKINKAGIENLSFAWAGGFKEGVAHYYRIQGPMLLIEFDNTQNNANHVHTAVRDLTNDFAEDVLKEHYEKEHR